MAGNSLVLGVEIIGEFKKLTAATNGAQSSLSSLNKRTAAISRSMTRAFAAIGIGFSLRTIVNELEQAGKAAAEDAKSMKILELAMINTGKATDKNVKQAEAFIKKMQFTAAVADDDLRPAYQKLFTATGDVTKANDLLKVAVDAAAYSGKDLSAVSAAMSKALAGSDTALVRLIPSLKGVNDPMAELARLTDGAAEAAANLDPYQRMQIVFGEMQEQIGTALLPTLSKFSDWLATPEGQEKLQGIIDLVVGVIEEFGNLASWVAENKDWLLPMVAAIGAVTTAFKAATVAANLFKAAATLGLAGGFGLAGAAGAAEVAWAAPIIKDLKGKSKGFPALSPSLGKGFKKQPVIQNITIKGSQSGTQIAKAIKKAQKTTGSTMGLR